MKERTVIISELNNKKFFIQRERDGDFEVISFRTDENKVFAARFFDSNIIPNIGKIEIKDLTDREKVLCLLAQSFIIK